MRTAVILAARKERDSLIPYPLKQFSDDVCLMDRNIAILRENGIENILIVVGFKHELFDKYKSVLLKWIYFLVKTFIFVYNICWLFTPFKYS